MEWKTIINPREKNGDLGKLKCDYCGCQTGAYVILNMSRMCKGCLIDGINAINKTILSNLKRKI
jgi:hypothetical protein